jgi:hypothetical protein
MAGQRRLSSAALADTLWGGVEETKGTRAWWFMSAAVAQTLATTCACLGV